MVRAFCEEERRLQYTIQHKITVDLIVALCPCAPNLVHTRDYPDETCLYASGLVLPSSDVDTVVMGAPPNAIRRLGNAMQARRNNNEVCIMTK